MPPQQVLHMYILACVYPKRVCNTNEGEIERNGRFTHSDVAGGVVVKGVMKVDLILTDFKHYRESTQQIHMRHTYKDRFESVAQDFIPSLSHRATVGIYMYLRHDTAVFTLSRATLRRYPTAVAGQHKSVGM